MSQKFLARAGGVVDIVKNFSSSTTTQNLVAVCDTVWAYVCPGNLVTGARVRWSGVHD